MPNPFLDHAFHIRWSQLVPDAIEPDIAAALEQAQAAIDALAAPVGEDEPLTAENTLLALEHATETLDLAWARVGHLDSVLSNDAQRQAYNRMLPLVS
jgi:oligopeptidase A